MKDFISHEGVGHDENPPGRGSGRYGWGSGKNPYQHQFNFMSELKNLRKKGFKDSEIAKMLLGEYATTNDLKAEIAINEKTERQGKIQEALKYLDQADGNRLKASRMMGIPASSVYKLVDPVLQDRTEKYQKTAEFLKNRIDTLGQPIDVSKGAEINLNVTRDTLKVAIAMLEKEGYIKGVAQVPQQGTINKTTVNVICPPDTDFNERIGTDGKPKKWISWRNTGIGSIVEFSPDNGKTFWVPKYPASLDSDRVFIRYGDQGGSDKDGVIEIRKGVKDLSLGKSNYAQLRIMVDNDHYMKGMAVYTDDIPDGYDIIYNTNKKTGSSFDKVFKPCKVSCPTDVVAKALGTTEADVNKRIKDHKLAVETVDDLKAIGIKNPQKYIDKDNPFGAAIKAGGQYEYEGANGKKQLSPVNKLTEEGDWDSWSKTLSAQFLSKQTLKTINQQLGMSIDMKRLELDQIKNLTNPVIKEKMLADFAKTCDANAADLSAKGFKNQAFQVILPVNMKDTECYAPRFKDGDTLALVRYPHAGIFEIPVVKVNNQHKQAKSVLGNAIDAIGINPKVASILSGADFDGDTVLAIPMKSNKISISHSKPLAALEGFDTKIYKVETDTPTITNRTKQRQMGETTNLIADMTLAGAPLSKVGKVVRHSMVVIDSEKHNLDWKRSMKDNDIIALKKEFQGVHPSGKPKGASTIITRAKGEAHIPDRKVVTDVKKMTPEQRKAFERGEVVYVDSGKMKRNYKTGKLEPKTIKVHGMDTVTDAMKLVRDPANLKEVAYANYANNLKELANEARREYRNIKTIPVSKEAKKTYASEVESLNNQLKRAQLNAPKERKAQEIAASIVSEKFKANPDMDYEHRQRERARAINQARSIVGANKDKIVISDREWEAIQANAISTSKLREILANTDQDKFKQRATPKKNANSGLTSNEARLAKNMYNSGMYTLADIAKALGVSSSTISKAVKES